MEGIETTVGCPSHQGTSTFMLGVALEHVHQGGYTDESWWTDADLKVMVFGQEPLNWPIPVLDDGSQVLSDDFVELYQRFYSDNYRGDYFLKDSDNHLAKNKFSTWALMASYRVSRTSFLTSNIPTRKWHTFGTTYQNCL